MLEQWRGVLSSRILLRPSDLDRSRRFYRDLLGTHKGQMSARIDELP
jgi:catechol 2,3-dioxygenase-like lactoylglutathione lyase family enzyme